MTAITWPLERSTGRLWNGSHRPDYSQFYKDSPVRHKTSLGVRYVEILGSAPLGGLISAFDRLPVAPALPDAGPGRRDELIRQVAGYLALADDWDGYGGVAAGPEAVGDAVRFVSQLPESLPLPKPMVSGSGVVGLYWEGNDRYASIDFDGSGFYCYIADRPNDEHGEDRVPVSQGPTQRLIEVIAETTDRF